QDLGREWLDEAAGELEGAGMCDQNAVHPGRFESGELSGDLVGGPEQRAGAREPQRRLVADPRRADTYGFGPVLWMAQVTQVQIVRRKGDRKARCLEQRSAADLREAQAHGLEYRGVPLRIVGDHA